MANNNFLDDTLLAQLWTKMLNTFETKGFDTVKLWENPNPTQSDGFNAQFVSIPTISNYKYIVIGWRYYYSSSSPNWKTQYDVFEYNSAGLYTIGGVDLNDDDTGASRKINFNSAGITFATGYKQSVGGTSKVANANYVIPIVVYGSNKLAMGVVDNEYGNNSTLLWSNPSPSAAYSASTLSGLTDLSTFKYLIIEWKHYKTDGGVQIQCIRNAYYCANAPTSETSLTRLCYSAQSAQAVRYIKMIANSLTSLSITYCYITQNGSSSYTTGSDDCIPVAIYGSNTPLGSSTRYYNENVDYSYDSGVLTIASL